MRRSVRPIKNIIGNTIPDSAIPANPSPEMDAYIIPTIYESNGPITNIAVTPHIANFLFWDCPLLKLKVNAKTTPNAKIKQIMNNENVIASLLPSFKLTFIILLKEK